MAPKNQVVSVDDVDLQSVAEHVKEALETNINIKAEWSAGGARELYQVIPKLRAACSRLEVILLEIERSRARFIYDRRLLDYEVEKAEDKLVPPVGSSSPHSWEERASIRRTHTFDGRLKLIEIRRKIDVLDVWHKAVERRYIQFLGAKADTQGMANLLRIGGILGEIQ